MVDHPAPLEELGADDARLHAAAAQEPVPVARQVAALQLERGRVVEHDRDLVQAPLDERVVLAGHARGVALRSAGEYGVGEVGGHAQERAQLDDAFGDAPLAEEVERFRGVRLQQGEGGRAQLARVEVGGEGETELRRHRARGLEDLLLAVGHELGQAARHQPPRITGQRLHDRGRPGLGGRRGQEREDCGADRGDRRGGALHFTGLAFRLTLPSLVSSRKSTACAPFSFRMRAACCEMIFWKLSNLTGAASPAALRASRKRSKSDRTASVSPRVLHATSPDPRRRRERRRRRARRRAAGPPALVDAVDAQGSSRWPASACSRAR